MKKKDWENIPNLDMQCFGCGPENDHGLKMTFETNGEKIRSSVMVPAHFRGWSNIVHGGVLATIFDEIMAWAAIYLCSRFILTKTINISFLKPVTIESRLEAIGYVKERIDDRNAILAGEICDDQGQVCATSTGEFVLYTPEYFKRFNLMSTDLFEKMTQVFDRS